MAPLPLVLRLRSTMVRAVVAPLLLSSVLGLGLAAAIRSLVADARALGRSDAVIGRVNALEKAVVDRESDLRGWLLHRDPRDLDAYARDVDAFERGWTALARETAEDGAALDALASIRRGERAWDANAREAIAGHVVERDGRAAAMADVAASFQRLASREHDRRAARLASMDRTSRDVLLGGVLLTVVIGAAIALYERRAIRRVESAYVDALESRDDFIHAASHDLRSPLAALRMQVQLLSRRGHDEAGLDRVRRSVDRMTALMDKLLDSSRIAQGQIDVEPRDVNLRDLVAGVIAHLDASAQAAGCAIALTGPRDLVGAWDPVRLEQVATNLLTNAIKYGAGAPIDVAIDAMPGARARITVRDRGIGVPEAERHRIFERFGRSTEARERRYPGLGLGLWITKRVVDAMGGAIGVESVAGRGSTFYVILPVGQATPIDARRASTSDAAPLAEARDRA